jgi:peroxiredoxin
MEKNNHMNAANWVNDRLATLAPATNWQPNVTAGLARLRDRCRTAHTRARTWKWAAATVAVTSVCLLAFPAPRVLAYRCIDCSVEFWQTLASPAPVRADLTPEKDRQPAPDFTLLDAAGKPLQLSALKGQVVLLNFWATWCHGCQVEIPWFIEFQSKYKDRGLAVVGVSLDGDGRKAVRPFLAEKKVNYSIVLGNDNVAKQFAIEGMPVTLLIDRQGRIAASHTGVVDKFASQSEIEILLNQSAATISADQPK